MRAFSSALDAVPLALAENSGLSPIETLTDVKSRQIKEKNSRLGIDCNGRGDNGQSFSFPLNNFRILTSLTYYRHEETIRLRSSDLKEATISIGHAGL
jgi:hypothetical protein